MRHLIWALALGPCISAGCMSPGEEVPWRRPGLGGGEISESFKKAVRDSGEDMKMTDELPTGRQHRAPRSVTED